MKYLLVPLLALGVGTAAIAAAPGTDAAPGSYPACSKTVKDECTESGATTAKAVTGAKHARKSAHHHHRPAATAAKSG